jgi:N-acetylmuramoyl-L-alanine amidase
MIEVKEHILPLNAFSRPGRLVDKIKGIVFHWTGNAGQEYHGTKRYFELLSRQDPHDEKPDIYASSHYIIGTEGAIIRVIPEYEMAYHAGTTTVKKTIRELGWHPNHCTIGVELCHLSTMGEFTHDTLEAARLLGADLCRRFHLDPLTQVYRHYDITRKECPLYFVRNPLEWTEFLGQIDTTMKAA